MHSFVRGVVTTCLALVLVSPALAQSKDDIASKINSSLPSTGRGQITAQSLRDVMNSFNGARGQPNGIAELGQDGRVALPQMPDLSGLPVFPSLSAASGTLGRLLANRAQITDDGSVIAAGINSRSIGQALIPYKPEWANTPGPERIRYQNLFELITSRDSDSWESPVAIEFRSRTGYNKSWQAGGTVAAGENIVGYSPNPEPYVYRVLQGGTLGSSSPTAGPNSAPFFNGTAQLQWINYSNLASKISLTNTVIASENAGQTWANNFNFIMNPLNGPPRFMTNTEFDFKNASGYDCDLFSGRTCNSITMFTGGPNRSTSILAMGALGGTTSFASEWGISMVGSNLVRDAAIEINTNSKVGIGLGRYSATIPGAVFSESSIQDQSTATEGLSLQGNYSNAAVHVSGSTPIALSMNAGQKLCFFGGENCFIKDNSQGKLLYQVGGVTVMSIADDGTIRAKGTITGGVPNP